MSHSTQNRSFWRRSPSQSVCLAWKPWIALIEKLKLLIADLTSFSGPNSASCLHAIVQTINLCHYVCAKCVIIRRIFDHCRFGCCSCCCFRTYICNIQMPSVGLTHTMNYATLNIQTKFIFITSLVAVCNVCYKQCYWRRTAGVVQWTVVIIFPSCGQCFQSSFPRCCDTVGWATGRESGLWKSLYHLSPGQSAFCVTSLLFCSLVLSIIRCVV